MKKDENDEKKRKLTRLLRKLLRKSRPRLGRGGSGGGRTRRIQKMRKTSHKYSPPKKPKEKPRPKKTHGTGKVEPWIEPAKQKIRKIVKHEVDSEKLLKELENGIEETLDKLAERIETDINDIQQQKVEEPEVRAEANFENNKIETSALQEDEESMENLIPENEELGLEGLLKEADVEDEYNTDSLESREDLPEQALANEFEDPDFETELILYNPEFWQEVGDDLWGEFNPIEPEAEYAPPEEAAMD
jgi:hypothetical protein